MSDPPRPTSPKPPRPLHYQRPIPTTRRHDGGARQLGCLVGAVLPVVAVALAATVGRFAYQSIAALPLLAFTVAFLFAGVVAGLSYAASSRRRGRVPIGDGFVWGRFFAGLSIAVAVWLLLIGMVVLSIAFVCGWR